MSKRALRSVVVSASLLCAPACSLVFDPAQYRGDGGPLGPDAPRPDAPGPDAPGLDAPGPDAPTPSACSEPSMRTALPSCGGGATDLTYCAPTVGGGELELDAGAAPSILGGPGTYVLDTLGNNLVMVAAPADSIADHAITLSSTDPELLTTSWIAERVFSRLTHTVTTARLEVDDSPELPMFSPGPWLLTALAATHGEQLVTGQVDAIPTQSVLWRCASGGCTMLESHDLTEVLAAYGQVAGAPLPFAAVDGRQVAFSRPRMTRLTLPATAAAAERLVGTDGPLVFSPSAGIGFFDDGMSVIATPSTVLGARVAHRSGDTSFVVASLSARPPFEVSTTAMTCTGSACTCSTGCNTPRAEVSIEVPTAAGVLVDWTFEVTEDDLRVAVLLVANMDGDTDVLVAAWRQSTSGIITPVHLASGVGFGGRGRSLRSVVRHVPGEMLEVFVSALVGFDSDGQDRLFLSGMRLQRCD